MKVAIVGTGGVGGYFGGHMARATNRTSVPVRAM